MDRPDRPDHPDRPHADPSPPNAASAFPDAPEPRAGFLSAFKRPAIRELAISRAAAKLALATISYGTMVYLATQGSPQWQISFVSASTYLSAVLFGLQGGVLADSLSKRIAIASGFAVLAVLCILMPLLFGTGVGELLILMFIGSALMQVISPSLKAAVSLVSSPREMATVSASVSIAGSIASAVGSSFLAPVLIKATSIDVLLLVAAAILVFGAVRTLRLPDIEHGRSFREAVETVDWRPKGLSLRATAEWLVANPAIGALILVGAIVVAIYEAFTTLIPVYVRDVLDANPADAIYIFAPAGIGFLAGMIITPLLIDVVGARRLAVLSVSIMAISMILFGLVGVVAPVLAPFSPLRLLAWLFSVEVNDKILAASFIAAPANFGSTAAGAAIQTYINARVPIERQGATFGLQEVQENLFTLALVLILGLFSTVAGPRTVFILSPVVAFALVIYLIQYSHRVTRGRVVTRREAWLELMGKDDPGPPPAG